MTPHEKAELTATLRQAANAVAEALSKLGTEPSDAPVDRLISAREASKRTGMSTRWLYLHAAELPFAHRIGPRALRFSERGIEQWRALKQSEF